MDPLGQLYLLCTILGWGFIIACFALGQIDHNGAAHDGGHLGQDGVGGHVGGAHGHGIGHGIGHGTHGLVRGVAESAHGAHGLEVHGGHTGHIGGHGAHPGGNGHGSGHTNGHSSNHGNQHGKTNDQTNTAVSPDLRARDNRIFFTLISIFSPMSMSLFTGFFGTVGYITWHYAHWLGYFTLLPAIGVSVIATETLKRTMSNLVTRLNSSSLTRKEDAIGRIAEVNTPIADGRLGEVTYIIGTTRFNMSAKSANPDEAFARGSKVMIVDTDGHVLIVEPARDIDLVL